MTQLARGRRAATELTRDRRFGGRVKRLAATSVVALGLIWALAATTLDASPLVGASLLAGWLTMPIVLLASLQRPALRYALVVPSSLVGLPLLAIVGGSLPASPVAAAGWGLITTGILLGGVLGLWFWFRLLPVPASLDDPFAPGRLGLIAGHVALIVTGIALAAVPVAG